MLEREAASVLGFKAAAAMLTHLASTCSNSHECVTVLELEAADPRPLT